MNRTDIARKPQTARTFLRVSSNGDSSVTKRRTFVYCVFNEKDNKILV